MSSKIKNIAKSKKKVEYLLFKKSNKCFIFAILMMNTAIPKSMVPTKFFLTKGMGEHKDKLQSFELALRSAGIEKFNLVSVSSIVPPDCDQITLDDGLKELGPGQIVFTVLSKNSTDEPHRLLSASVGVAIPAEKSRYGYLSEFKAFGMREQESGDYSEDLAATMLATTLGLEFDPDTAYDERKEVYKMSGKIIKTKSITQSAVVNKDGLWTTVVAAAVFVF